MTAVEMVSNFELLVGYLNKNVSGRLDTVDVARYLNRAQSNYIHRKLNARTDDIDSNKRDIHELKVLYVPNRTLSFNDSTSTESIFVLPLDYMLPLIIQSRVTYCGQAKWYDNRLVSNEKVGKILGYPFTKTVHTSPVCAIYNDKLYVYLDDYFTVNSARLSYIRRAIDIDPLNEINCELDEIIHQEIVSLSVLEYLQIVSPERVNTFSQINSLITEQLKEPNINN